MPVKSAIKSIPLLGAIATRVARSLRRSEFDNSADYWERRYDRGGTSGAGSYNRLAQFKADFLNRFVRDHQISSVVEFGSGDGAQLELADYASYIGVDVSPTAIATTRARFSSDRSKKFLHSSEVPKDLSADLALSLDVVYHLVEDRAFEHYMASLFDAARRFVIVYSSNSNEPSPVPHVRHRCFTDWVSEQRADFVLSQHVPNAYPFDERDPDNTSFADFYVFERA